MGTGHPTYNGESLYWIYKPPLLGWWPSPTIGKQWVRSTWIHINHDIHNILGIIWWWWLLLLLLTLLLMLMVVVIVMLTSILTIIYEQDIAHGDKGLLQKRPSTTRNQMTTAATRTTNVVIKTKTIFLHVLLQNDPSIMTSLYSYQVGRCDCYML